MMSFGHSCRNILLNGSVLSADARACNGTWARAQIDLDDHLGNRNGRFDIAGHHFWQTACAVSLDGVLLRARLLDVSKAWGDVVALNLNFVVENRDGRLEWKNYSPDIRESCICFRLEHASLQALCLARDGMFRLSAIDLDAHLSNEDGAFLPGGANASHTARDFRLLPGQPPVLAARLECRNKDWRPAQIDLARLLVNDDGVLAFQEHDVAEKVAPFTEMPGILLDAEQDDYRRVVLHLVVQHADSPVLDYLLNMIPGRTYLHLDA